MDTAVPDRYRRLDAFLQRLRDDIYPEPPSPGHTAISRKMFAHLAGLYPPAAQAKVLDIGCGQGVGLEMFVEAGRDPLGITLGEDVQACRAKGLNAVEMDLSFLDFPDETFDLVWRRHALEHSIFPFFTLSEMHRCCVPAAFSMSRRRPPTPPVSTRRTATTTASWAPACGSS